MSAEESRRKSTRRSRKTQADTDRPSFNARGASSGALRTLSDDAILSIHHAALDVLETVGFGEAPDSTRELLINTGGWMNTQGRLCLPRSLVEDAISKANRSLTLHGQDKKHDVEVGGTRTYFSTGCGSVRVVDPKGKTVRQMTAVDVYDFARIVDVLENIHVFHRCGTPTDIEDIDDVDINLCYACVRGTSKHVSSSWFNGHNVKRCLEMLHYIAGSEKRWRARPFVSNVSTFVVPPLNFSPEACLGLEHAVRGGMPVQLTSAGQMGATAPVTVAGTMVQTMAEVLGGLVYALEVSPSAKVILGTWPMVSDLRTGAVTTGSAEQALLSSASCQISRFYGIPNGTISGISDSKLPDAQAGFEKGIQHVLVGNSGGNILFCAAGSLAGGMGCSPAGIVIDNEIIGASLRTVAGFCVDEEELAVDAIKSVCLDGPGHYLGHQQTLERMKSNFFYPRVSDRSSIKDWIQNGSPSVLDNATGVVDQILATHFPTHVSGRVDETIREKFNIMLPADACARSTQTTEGVTHGKA